MPYNIVKPHDERVGTFPASFPKSRPLEVVWLFVSFSHFKAREANEAKQPAGGNRKQGDEFEETESVLDANSGLLERAVNKETEGEAEKGNKSGVETGGR